ncbi:MAG: sulfotransferase domain-containing protein [Anaerolineae bacterium]
MPGQVVTIVSGLPRSGTSMMMQMLEAGGIPALKDDIRRPDEDNPKGYYEFERVKQIATDQAWLEDAQGKVVKMVSALLPKLPPTYSYHIVFMRRRMEEILASQKVMLARREQKDKTSDKQMAAFFNNHLAQISKWLGQQPNIQVLYIHYNELLENPALHIQELNRFLGGNLDMAKMTAIVDHKLYRERKN